MPLKPKHLTFFCRKEVEAEPGLEEACDIRLFKINETTSTKNKDGALIDVK